MKFLILLSILCQYSFAAKEHHKGHHHGQAEINIIFEGKKGEIELEIPGGDVFGFEHQAKSADDKKKQQIGLKLLEEKIAEIITFDSSKQCQWGQAHVEVHQEGKHSAAKGHYQVTCQQTLNSSVIKFNFKNHLPHLEKLVGVLIVDSAQIPLKLKSIDEVSVK